MQNCREPVTYLVSAATGTIGGILVGELRARGAEVLAASRRERDWPDDVRGVVADLEDPDAFARAARRVAGAFLMAGYPSEAGLLRALPDGARVVLLSSSAAPSGNTENPVAAYHVKSERAVAASGHPWTFLQPNSFMTNVLRWKDDLEAGDVVHLPFVDVPVAMVDPADVGAVAAAALLDDGHAGQRYRLSGPEALRPPEQVTILGEALDRDLRLAPVADADTDPTFGQIFRGGLADETTVHPTVERILRRPPGTFTAWARAHRDAFSSDRSRNRSR